MRKLIIFLFIVFSTITVYAQQRAFTYEVVKSGGSYYACFYKTREYSGREVIIHYRIHFYSDRSSQTRMAIILASGSQDRSNGYDEDFHVEITNWSASDALSSANTSSSDASSGASSSGYTPGYTRPSVSAASVVWAEKNSGAADFGVFGGYYAFSQRACPGGWRLPTNPELRSLAASRSEWTTVNGVDGRRFYTGSQEVFLPAAGYNGAVDKGKTGIYRSDTASDNDDSWALTFGKGKKPRVKAGFGRRTAYSVRCVKE